VRKLTQSKHKKSPSGASPPLSHSLSLSPEERFKPRDLKFYSDNVPYGIPFKRKLVLITSRFGELYCAGRFFKAGDPEVKWKCKLQERDRKLGLVLRELRNILNSSRGHLRAIFIGLTYKDWNAFKQSIEESKDIRWFLKNLKRGRFAMHVYNLEFQKRGVPHYHAIVILEKKDFISFPDKTLWKWGSSNVKALSPKRFTFRYLARYVLKNEQLELAKYECAKRLTGRRFRLFGCSRKLLNFLRIVNKFFADAYKAAARGWTWFIFRQWLKRIKNLEVIPTLRFGVGKIELLGTSGSVVGELKAIWTFSMGYLIFEGFRTVFDDVEVQFEDMSSLLLCLFGFCERKT